MLEGVRKATENKESGRQPQTENATDEVPINHQCHQIFGHAETAAQPATTTIDFRYDHSVFRNVVYDVHTDVPNGTPAFYSLIYFHIESSSFSIGLADSLWYRCHPI